MAYRFQDLQGNWRIRYDDGTTSPVIGNVSAALQDSTLEFSDASIGGKSVFGVDEDFSGSKASLNHAIIERAAGDARIATYQQEFQPLAETAMGQDMLINSVLANAAAPLEARAGAIQALYPGMKAEIGIHNELSLSAKGSSLGFQYPEKTAAQAAKDRSPAGIEEADIDFGAVLQNARAAINDIQNASDLAEAGELMTSSLVSVMEAVNAKRDYLKQVFTHEYGIEALEESLKQNRLLDAQAKIADPSVAWRGDSEQTKEVHQTLQLRKAERDAALEQAMNADPQLKQLIQTQELLESVGKHTLGEIASTKTLLVGEQLDLLNATFNPDGSPLSPKQLRELSNKIATEDKSTMMLLNLSEVPMSQFVPAAMELPPIYQKVAERIFEHALGEDSKGLFSAIKAGMQDLDSFVEKNGIILPPDTAEELKKLSDTISSRIADKTAKEEAAVQMQSIKSAIVMEHFRDMRDLEAEKSILSGDAVPAIYGDIWRSATESAKAIKQAKFRASVRSAEGGWKIGTSSKVAGAREAAALREKEADLTAITLDDILQEFAVKFYLSNEATKDIATDVSNMEAAVTSWLTAQADNPRLKDLLGKNTKITPSNINAKLLLYYGRAASSSNPSWGL